MKVKYKTICKCGACGKVFETETSARRKIGTEVLHHGCEGSEYANRQEGVFGHCGIAEVIKSVPFNSEQLYKALYKCRLCGEEFVREAEPGWECPTAPVCTWHECVAGVHGFGDLLGTYEVDL